MKYAAFLLAFAPALFGQAGTASVEGQVVNSVTGAPVRRAVVTARLQRMLSTSNQAMPQNPGTAETDEQGRFAIRGLQPGGYGLIVQRQGFSAPGAPQTNARTATLMVG